MGIKNFKFSKLELVLLLALALLGGIPFFLTSSNKWKNWWTRENTTVTVVRLASSQNDQLGLEKYQVEGTLQTTVLPSSFRSYNGDLLRFDRQAAVRIMPLPPEGLIEIRNTMVPEPLHAFNERILLVTGRQSDLSSDGEE